MRRRDNREAGDTACKITVTGIDRGPRGPRRRLFLTPPARPARTGEARAERPG